MKKIFFFALIAAISFSACGESEFDEQMDAISVVGNKGNKTETTVIKSKGKDKNEKNGIMLCAPNKTKTEKDPFSKDKDKNEKNGVMPIMETRSAIVYRPLGGTYEDYNTTNPIKR